MRQILELLQGTSHPWTYLGYDGPKVWTKLLKALEIIEQAKLEGRKVMIASPWVETANGMEELFSSKGYPVFRITTEMSKTKRATLVHEFRNFPGFAIITGTMGCLKSWLNLPEVSVVIAESYPWNFAQLKQYAARAIRLNSTEKTIIHCLCSEWSFDVNVFGLLVKKEVTNEFVRTSEEVSTEDIRKELWVGDDDDFYEAALRMVRERVDGRIRWQIKWNDKQVIS
jgi:SNF2 family DNA or RNA helicase